MPGRYFLYLRALEFFPFLLARDPRWAHTVATLCNLFRGPLYMGQAGLTTILPLYKGRFFRAVFFSCPYPLQWGRKTRIKPFGRRRTPVSARKAFIPCLLERRLIFRRTLRVTL